MALMVCSICEVNKAWFYDLMTPCYCDPCYRKHIASKPGSGHPNHDIDNCDCRVCAMAACPFDLPTHYEEEGCPKCDK